MINWLPVLVMTDGKRDIYMLIQELDNFQMAALSYTMKGLLEDLLEI